MSVGRALVQARELEELAQIYVSRGLPYGLARQVGGGRRAGGRAGGKGGRAAVFAGALRERSGWPHSTNLWPGMPCSHCTAGGSAAWHARLQPNAAGAGPGAGSGRKPACAPCTYLRACVGGVRPQVAEVLTEKDVIRAHARDELGIDIDELANPLQVGWRAGWLAGGLAG